MNNKADSLYKARERLLDFTGLDPDDWNVSADPVTGIGDEFFFVHKGSPKRFVYICVEEGIVTCTESN